MRQLASLLARHQNPNHQKAVELLKAEVTAGWLGLRDEMAEADAAFFGNEQMLNQVLNVGCLKFAADAYTKLPLTGKEVA